MRTFAYSNLIEGLWGTMKFYIKHIYNTISGEDDLFIHYLHESLWRINLRKKEGSNYYNYLISTFRFDPPGEKDDSRKNSMIVLTNEEEK